MKQKQLMEVINQTLYNQIQVFLIKTYIKARRDMGDERDRNIIATEWIKDHSKDFRETWCNHQ